MGLPAGYIRPVTLEVDTCVVGSGLGGLAIALELEKDGCDYLVLDKGRTPGGRAATRRFADSRFDHGLPWLNQTGPLTSQLIKRGFEAGILVKRDMDGQEAWFCPAGISSLGKYLAGGLKIRNATRVTRIDQQADGLMLTTESEGERSEIHVRHRLFLAMPLPQALELAEPVIGESFRPEADPFDKCIVAMVQAEPDPPGEAESGQIVPDYLKFPDVLPGFSFRLTAEESDDLWDAGDETIKSFVREATGVPVEGDLIQLMKWRFANGSGAVKEPFFTFDAGPVSIAICGDAFFGGTASGTEASLMSCQAAHQALSQAKEP